MFDFAGCSEHDCWTKNIGPVARVAPVVATELGQRACSSDFMQRFMRWADSSRVSYIGWSWNPAGCDAPSLIESWDGAPTDSGARFHDYLARSNPAPRRFKAP
jgi:hypothetical protein